MVPVERDRSMLAKIHADAALLFEFAGEFGIHLGGEFGEELKRGTLIAMGEHAPSRVRGFTTKFTALEHEDLAAVLMQLERYT